MGFRVSELILVIEKSNLNSIRVTRGRDRVLELYNISSVLKIEFNNSHTHICCCEYLKLKLFAPIFSGPIQCCIILCIYNNSLFNNIDWRTLQREIFLNLQVVFQLNETDL